MNFQPTHSLLPHHRLLAYGVAVELLKACLLLGFPIASFAMKRSGLPKGLVSMSLRALADRRAPIRVGLTPSLEASAWKPSRPSRLPFSAAGLGPMLCPRSSRWAIT